MKKVICLFSAFLLLLSSAITTYVHETDSQDYLSIPSYNKTYSAQPTDNNFLSLKEYNTEYSNGENPLNKQSASQVAFFFRESRNQIATKKSVYQNKLYKYYLILSDFRRRISTITLYLSHYIRRSPQAIHHLWGSSSLTSFLKCFILLLLVLLRMFLQHLLCSLLRTHLSDQHFRPCQNLHPDSDHLQDPVHLPS